MGAAVARLYENSSQGTGCTAPTGGETNCDCFYRIWAAYCDVSSVMGEWAPQAYTALPNV